MRNVDKKTIVETVVQLVNIGVKPQVSHATPCIQVRVDVDVDEMYKTIGEDKRIFLT